MISKIVLQIRKNVGQVTLEYFVIFAVIALALGIFGSGSGPGSMGAEIRDAVGDLMRAAFTRMTGDDLQPSPASSASSSAQPTPSASCGDGTCAQSEQQCGTAAYCQQDCPAACSTPGDRNNG